MKAILTKYHGATNTRGSRVSASAEGGHRVSIPYPHELHGMAVHAAAAVKLCQQLKWKGPLMGGGLPNGDYCFVFAHAGNEKFEVRGVNPVAVKHKKNPDDKKPFTMIFQVRRSEKGEKKWREWMKRTFDPSRYAGGYAERQRQEFHASAQKWIDNNPGYQGRVITK